MKSQAALVLSLTVSFALMGCTNAPERSMNSLLTTSTMATPIEASFSSDWSAVLPAGKEPVFHGALMNEENVNGYAQLYVASDMFTFMASVAIHSAFASSRLSEKQISLQREADKVLEPYQAIIATMDMKGMYHRSMLKLDPSDQPTNIALVAPFSRPSIELAANYSMTQDRSALVLILMGKINSQQSAKQYMHVTQVVSAPISNSSTTHWLTNNGANLRQTSESLLTQGMQLLVEDIKGRLAGGGQQQSVRYQIGDDMTIERAVVVASNCGRKVLRNLRNWIVSVPVKGKCSS